MLYLLYYWLRLSQMSIIYCLFSTLDGVPHYVGKTTGASRLRQHESSARCGSLQPVHEWMRDEWCGGFEIHEEVIEYNVSEDRAHRIETSWMNQFPDLYNERKYVPSQLTAPGKKIVETCKVRLADIGIEENYCGFRGVRRWCSLDAFTVTICRGSRRVHVRGDFLPGHPYDFGEVWFPDAALAIEARDAERAELQRIWPELRFPSDNAE
jgi:hypothetical protein